MTKHPPSPGFGVPRECRSSGITIVRHLVIRHSFELRHSDFVIDDAAFSPPTCSFRFIVLVVVALDDLPLALKLLALAPIYETLSAFYYCCRGGDRHAGERRNALSRKAAAFPHHP